MRVCCYDGMNTRSMPYVYRNKDGESTERSVGGEAMISRT